MEDVDLHFTVSYRGKILQLIFPAKSTVGELGQRLVDLTGVAPQTIKLMLPKRPVLQPMLEQHSSTMLYQFGISEGLMVRMLGSSTSEVATVSQGLAKDTRVRGFAEEEEIARRRSSFDFRSNPLPKGNYIFCDFRTLSLPGLQLTPPPSVALGIMHRLASDRGTIAIMNKYRWRVGVMTEMAPVGYVGVSPKCILGFNKNRGEEISLRLRTDDLKGFRKYESIQKTLLHELAHMVHDEHDEKFHALDKKLNEEVIALDWTKSHGHTLSGARFDEVEEMDAGGVHTFKGRRLGGSRDQTQYMDPRAAAAAAALRRFDANSNTGIAVGQTSASIVTELPASKLTPVIHDELDPDDLYGDSIAVIAEGSIVNREPDPDAAVEIVPKHSRTDSERVEHMNGSQSHAEPDPDDDIEMVPRGNEPDPDNDDEVTTKDAERDPDDNGEKLVRAAEPDPDDDEIMVNRAEPDPDDDETMVKGAEPDPDDDDETMSSIAEPDPDDRKEKLVGFVEPKRAELTRSTQEDHGNEMLSKRAMSDSDDENERPVEAAEPDPDDSDQTCKRHARETCSPIVAGEYKHQCSF